MELVGEPKNERAESKRTSGGGEEPSSTCPSSDEDDAHFPRAFEAEPSTPVKTRLRSTLPFLVSPTSPPQNASASRQSPGLSELSKQLTVLQAKNESQSVEMERLKRQLKIISDLEGISLADVKRALAKACEAEAHGELNHRVASLRTQLEAISLASGGEAADTQLAASLRERIVELETTDKKKVLEIGELKSQLEGLSKEKKQLQDEKGQMSEKVSQLHIELKERDSQLRDMTARLADKERIDEATTKLRKEEDERTRALHEDENQITKLRATLSNEVTLLAESSAQIEALQAEHSRTTELLSEKESEIATLQASHGRNSTMLVEKQKAVDMLRTSLDQNAALLSDTEAIVTSLRTTNQDLHAEREALRSDLAKTRDKIQDLRSKLVEMERKMRALEEQLVHYRARSMVQAEQLGELTQQTSSLYTAYDLIHEDQAEQKKDEEALQTNLHEADAEIARQVHRNESRKQSAKVSTVQRSGATSASILASLQREPILAGVLYLRSSRLMRKWRKRHAILFATLTHHYLDFGDGEGYTLQFGVSKVALSQKRAYAVTVCIDPNNLSESPLHVAAPNATDFDKWFEALKAATIGYDSNTHEGRVEVQNEAFRDEASSSEWA